ncbi:MAG: aldo/keto reductase [Candidatus Saccharimonadales bacterium]
MQTFDFNGHTLSRVFKGNWQLAGGHGDITHQQAIADLQAYIEHGVNAFDMGDIYTGAEELLGELLRQYTEVSGTQAASALRMHTKFVPDLNALEDLNMKDVRRIIERSCKRLGVNQLHLVQFHWWDYTKGDYLAAAKMLDELRTEGLIEHIGLTNFDVEHMKALLDAGIPIVSNQIQFSLLDPRPFNGMLEFAQQHGIAIFCYGVLAGGLLGSAHPQHEETNRSHIKYGLVIDEVGTPYYQALLKLLANLATKYHTTVANIATRYVLQTGGVSSAILGPRNATHIAELDELFTFELSIADYTELKQYAQQPLAHLSGDIYSYERILTSPHGRIMKYNLNGMRPDQQ